MSRTSSTSSSASSASESNDVSCPIFNRSVAGVSRETNLMAVRAVSRETAWRCDSRKQPMDSRNQRARKSVQSLSWVESYRGLHYCAPSPACGGGLGWGSCTHRREPCLPARRPWGCCGPASGSPRAQAPTQAGEGAREQCLRPGNDGLQESAIHFSLFHVKHRRTRRPSLFHVKRLSAFAIPR